MFIRENYLIEMSIITLLVTGIDQLPKSIKVQYKMKGVRIVSEQYNILNTSTGNSILISTKQPWPNSISDMF